MNYDIKMEEQIKKIPEGTKLLLHACCAPCSSAVLERCWITIMSNRNVPAVCSLTDAAMVIFAEDVTPDDAALEAAVDNDLNFYRSPLSVFELCAKVASLLS